MATPNPWNLAQGLGLTARDAVSLVQRAGATGRNAAELAVYGGLRVEEEHSPFEVVVEQPMFRLRRYFPEEIPEGLPSLLLVPPLMMMAEVFDVAPRSSSVQAIHADGVDVWVVDFGRPEDTEGGLERSVADHILALSDAVDAVREATGRDVVLGGYSQGGMFAYQAGAYRRNDGIDSIITFGSPADFKAAPLPIPISAETYATIAETMVKTGIFEKVSLPGWFNRSATRMLDPIKNVQYQVSYLRQLHDRDKLLPGEQQRQFLDKGGWTNYSGPALTELMNNAFINNRILQGGLVIGDHSVAMADLDVPILTVIGEIDKEGHPLSVRAIAQAAPRAEIYELMLQTGHFGIVAGGGARRNTWPRVAQWIRWRAGASDLPEEIVPAAEGKPTRGWSPSAWAQRVQDTTDLGLGMTRLLTQSATQVVDSINTLARDRAQQFPLLNRIEALRPTTAVSLGLLLDEAARRDPDGAFLVFGDRVLRHREVKHRVDSVVKGLIQIGVHPGDRVGVLMDSRPSAFSVLAAISRLGAGAVLLRPDGDLIREIELAAVSLVISDPENVLSESRHAFEEFPDLPWAVLGGGSEPRELPGFVQDLEAIDPDKVSLPQWYRPNPTRAADLAMVLFIGTGEHTRTRLITNRRWVMSALGTASAANLKPGHTVYSTTPLYHSSALLMAVAGAVAAGSRLAFASACDPDTFWSEVRRYGATHVSFTWTSLRAVTYGPPNPGERHHPIQLFMGSGMPRNLWRRVSERFAPARVLEFYASTDAEAILANVSGAKIGAAGRPVPGTPKLAVVSTDLATGRIAYGPDGFARECDPGRPGLLLVENDASHPGRAVLRSVLRTDDAWQSTGDIFTKDVDGDYWLVDMAEWLVPSDDGPVAPSRVQNALTSLPAVDLATVYGVADRKAGTALLAAVTLLEGAELNARDLEVALSGLAPAHRPRFIRVLEDIPLTTWSRVQWRPLAAAGLPKRKATGEVVWALKRDGSYGRV